MAGEAQQVPLGGVAAWRGRSFAAVLLVGMPQDTMISNVVSVQVDGEGSSQLAVVPSSNALPFLDWPTPVVGCPMLRRETQCLQSPCSSEVCGARSSCGATVWLSWGGVGAACSGKLGNDNPLLSSLEASKGWEALWRPWFRGCQGARARVKALLGLGLRLITSTPVSAVPFLKALSLALLFFGSAAACVLFYSSCGSLAGFP
uniref:Uncharacterized protein n=1 Tax=Oryza meridionalis TaxID=40149 RepID=A0A0E0C198_9ORYZ